MRKPNNVKKIRMKITNRTNRQLMIRIRIFRAARKTNSRSTILSK